jgi:hypothetical protein
MAVEVPEADERGGAESKGHDDQHDQASPPGPPAALDRREHGIRHRQTMYFRADLDGRAGEAGTASLGRRRKRPP